MRVNKLLMLGLRNHLFVSSSGSLFTHSLYDNVQLVTLSTSQHLYQYFLCNLLL